MAKAMPNSEQAVTLSELDARLRAHHQRAAENEVRRFHRRITLPGSTVTFASRVLNDLIAALLISIAFGAAIDAAFDSWPWGILALFLLGSVAAVRNVYQTASKMAEAEAEAAQPASPFTKRG